MQHTSDSFAQVCTAGGVRQSMGMVGSSAGNRLAGAFFTSLKREIIPARDWQTTHQVRLEIFRWRTFYKPRRTHSALCHLSPIEYEIGPTTAASAA